MIYQSVSINEVIARVIRNTRITDTSYIFDMNEWIPEAMGYMRTKYSLVPRYEDVTINFHKGKLPCTLHHIKAVEYNGRRLPEGNSSKNIRTGHSINNEEQKPVISTIAPTVTPTGTSTWNTVFSTDVVEVCNKDVHPDAYYQIELGHITTSFADGVVRVHFAAIPCDTNDLPLIPDNEDYKQALYYYIRAMMVGAGFKDQVFNENTLMQRFELHATRAIGQITYPSVDAMEAKINNMVRFVPQANYFDNFFRSSTPEGNF